jgi:hypothetical protein
MRLTYQVKENWFMVFVSSTASAVFTENDKVSLPSMNQITAN